MAEYGLRRIASLSMSLRSAIGKSRPAFGRTICRIWNQAAARSIQTAAAWALDAPVNEINFVSADVIIMGSHQASALSARAAIQM